MHAIISEFNLFGTVLKSLTLCFFVSEMSEVFDSKPVVQKPEAKIPESPATKGNVSRVIIATHHLKYK